MTRRLLGAVVATAALSSTGSVLAYQVLAPSYAIGEPSAASAAVVTNIAVRELEKINRVALSEAALLSKIDKTLLSKINPNLVALNGNLTSGFTGTHSRLDTSNGGIDRVNTKLDLLTENLKYQDSLRYNQLYEICRGTLPQGDSAYPKCFGG